MVELSRRFTLPLSLAQPASSADAVPDRYELKYLVPEWQTDAIRRAIAPFCVLDPHAARAPDHAYAIQSLYLDTPSRDLYRVSQERRAVRWKARARCYPGSDTVFLEIKAKDHDMVRKQRARIPAAAWAERLPGPVPWDASPAEQVFRARCERHGLVPTLMVRYQREAWLSTVDTYARVTFDRRIVCQPWREWSLDADEQAWLALDGASCMGGVPRGVVLELKCLSAVPRWLSQLARDLSLSKARYSKYCKGIARVDGRDALLDGPDQP